MDWCDSSTVDWQAVGAIGTWAVGVVAAWLAVKANALAVSVREVEAARNQSAARAMVSGLYTETKTYASRLRALAETMTHLGTHPPGFDIGGHAAAALRKMENEGLSDFVHRVAMFPFLPEELASKISVLHAKEKRAQAAFSTNVIYFDAHKSAVAVLPQVLNDVRDTAQSVQRLAAEVSETAEVMRRYLGGSPDEAET